VFKTTLGALALALSLAQATAAPSESRITFVGHAFIEKTKTVSPQGGLIEFAPAHETRQNWTRLVGYRAFLDSRQTAYEAASAHARQMRERYPSERYPGSSIRDYEGRGEALAEFCIVMPDGTIEYSVFRYAPGPGGRGLVSLRYSRRLREGEVSAMSKEAARWAREVAGFDMNRVRTALAQSRD
jgi:hypothetical protein